MKRLLAWLAAFSLTVIATAHPSVVAAATPAVAPDQQILVMVQHPPDHYRPNAAYGGGYGDGMARSERAYVLRMREEAERSAARAMAPTTAPRLPPSRDAA